MAAGDIVLVRNQTLTGTTVWTNTVPSTMLASAVQATLNAAAAPTLVSDILLTTEVFDAVTGQWVVRDVSSWPAQADWLVNGFGCAVYTRLDNIAGKQVRVTLAVGTDVVVVSVTLLNNP